MTTDTHPKTMAVRFRAAGRAYTIGAVAKGSGMIHPDMATMFCFITTDAAVERRFLRAALRAAVDDSLNMMSVDSDTSTSDTTAIFANGAAGGPTIDAEHAGAAAFQRALRYVCIAMAKMLARDGEGAEKLIEVRIEGAATDKRGARRCAHRQRLAAGEDGRPRQRPQLGPPADGGRPQLRAHRPRPRARLARRHRGVQPRHRRRSTSRPPASICAARRCSCASTWARARMPRRPGAAT